MEQTQSPAVSRHTSSPHISLRAERVPDSPMRRFHDAALQVQRQGRTVHFLNIGQPDIPTPQVFFDTLRQYAGTFVGYAPSPGFPETIRAWQTYYRSGGIPLDEKNIIVTMGGSEALQFALMAVADPGDEVVLFEPTYASYISFATMLGIRIASVPLDASHAFHLPDDAVIERAITPRTRAILVCNPANPTGTVFSQAEVQRIGAIARRYGLFIIADEVYREFVYTGAPHYSFLADASLHDQVIMIDSVSKRFNVCGARIGAVVSRNASVLDALGRFARSRLSVPTLEQLAVIPLLTDAGGYVAGVVAEYARRRAAVMEAQQASRSIGWYAPEGAFYTIATLPVADTVDFVSWTLTQFQEDNSTILVAPGTGFYVNPDHGRHQIRIAFVIEAEPLRHALALLEHAVAEYQKNH